MMSTFQLDRFSKFVIIMRSIGLLVQPRSKDISTDDGQSDGRTDRRRVRQQ